METATFKTQTNLVQWVYLNWVWFCDGYRSSVSILLCLPWHSPPPGLKSSVLLLHIQHSPPPLSGWYWTVLRSSPSTRRATTGGGMVWRWAPDPLWPAWSLLQTVERWWWGSLRRRSSLRLVRHPREKGGLWFPLLINSVLILLSSEKIGQSSSTTGFMLCCCIN